MMNGMFGGGMWFGWIFWLIILGVIIWAVVQFTNRNQNQNTNVTPGKTPLQILKERYAKGEITKEQYEQMKQDLMN